MKANYVIIAALGAFALTAVSCINGNWGGKDTQIDNSVTVEIEQEPVVVPSNDILDYGKSQLVTPDKEGNLQLSIEAKGSASITTYLNEGEATEIPGQLEMTASKEELPEFCSSESGAVFSDARVVITLKNPSPAPVLFHGKIGTGDKKADLPDLLVPAATEEYKIALTVRKDHDIPIDEEFKANEEIVITDNVAEVINHISTKEGIVIKDLTVEPATKAIAPASEGYEFSVGATLHVPLFFPAGTVLKYDIDFTGELIDVSKYNVTVNDYQIEADVTNTIPFEISGTGTSTNGVYAELDTPIKAGDVNAPANTKVYIHIKSTATVVNLEGAVLHLVLKTDKDVRLKKNQKLDIDMKSIKFSEKK
jgi:hypothetical protein